MPAAGRSLLDNLDTDQIDYAVYKGDVARLAQAPAASAPA